MWKRPISIASHHASFFEFQRPFGLCVTDHCSNIWWCLLMQTLIDDKQNLINDSKSDPQPMETTVNSIKRWIERYLVFPNKSGCTILHPLKFISSGCWKSVIQRVAIVQQRKDQRRDKSLKVLLCQINLNLWQFAYGREARLHDFSYDMVQDPT